MSKPSALPSVVRAQAMPEGTMAVPVVIVGGGSCGLTAGIALREAGLDAAGVWVVAAARRRGSVRAQRVIDHGAGEDRHTDQVVEAERTQALGRFSIARDP